MLTRRELLAGAAALPLVGCSGGKPGDFALKRAAKFLWDLQDPTGAWPSRRYGLLKSGQSTTPFVLLSLATIPPDLVPFPADRASAALGFLLAQAGTDGAIGFASDPPDYPVYATSLTVSCLARLAPPGWQDAARPLAAWLEGQQRAAGFETTAAEGGFPMGSREPVVPGEPGHVDLSMSRRALEALQAVGFGPDHAAVARGLAFARRCQTDDGSFVYSPVEQALNKGHRDDGASRGYGSATTDGLLAMLACGAPEDADVMRGLTWLRANHRTDENPGISGGPNEPFAKAMRGYYRAGAAAVFRALGGPEGWREALVAAVIAEQHDDGGFANEEALQKEDDPLIATGFAIQALAHASV